jgi:DNA-binding NarL/FixJ family response regulator
MDCGKDIRFKINPASNKDGPFQSVLVLDDTEETLEYLCTDIADRHKNALVCGCLKPNIVYEIFKHCFCDVFVCDMKLGETTGDILIKYAKAYYPKTFVVAYTSYLTELGPLAAQGVPDKLVHKTPGNMDIFFNAVMAGLSQGRENRAKIEVKMGKHDKKEHWRNADKFKKSVGYSPTRYTKSFRKTEAIALRKLCPGMSWGKIAEKTGYVSVSKLKNDIFLFLPFL